MSIEYMFNLRQECELDNAMKVSRPDNAGFNTIRNRRRAIGLALLGGLTISAPSYAYIDPGTGSIILQSLLAGIAVAIGVVRGYWARIQAFFSQTRQPLQSETKSDEIPESETSEAPQQP